MRYFFFLLWKLISFKFGFYIGFTWDIRVLPRTAPSAVSTIGPSCPTTSFKQTNAIRPIPHGGFVNDDFIYKTEETKILLDSIWNHIIESLSIQGDPRNMTVENLFKVVFDIWNYLPHSFQTFILEVGFFIRNILLHATIKRIDGQKLSFVASLLLLISGDKFCVQLR